MPNMVKATGRKYPEFWVQYIKQLIRKNKNFLCIITGPTGSGKSWTGLSLGKMIDPDFDLSRVIFSGKELMRLINSGELGNKKGTFLMWDEAGIDLSNRSWQSVTNKMLNFLLQTFRHRCFILFFTTPYIDFLDKQSRKLFDAEFQTIRIDYKKRVVVIKPRILQYSGWMQKFYHKQLQVITKEDGAVPIDTWGVPAPDKDFAEKYETKKKEFTSRLNKMIEEELDNFEHKKIKTKKPLTELQQKILDLWEAGTTRQQDIADILGKTQPQISQNMGYLRRKGYTL